MTKTMLAYMAHATELFAARHEAGGHLPQDEEVEFVAAMDHCWRDMSEDEQDLVEEVPVSAMAMLAAVHRGLPQEDGADIPWRELESSGLEVAELLFGKSMVSEVVITDDSHRHDLCDALVAKEASVLPWMVPKFVRKEIDEYLDCGQLEKGSLLQ